MAEGSAKAPRRRASNATPSAGRAASSAPDAKPAPKAKPTEADRQKRLHYRRLVQHIDELKYFITHCLPEDPAIAAREKWVTGRWAGMRSQGAEPPERVRFDAFARKLKDLDRGLRELIADLESEDWSPALLERCYRDSALAVVRKELPVLEEKVQSGRPTDYARFAKARRRKNALIAHEQRARIAR